jgi:hypothetical protein
LGYFSAELFVVSFLLGQIDSWLGNALGNIISVCFKKVAQVWATLGQQSLSWVTFRGKIILGGFLPGPLTCLGYFWAKEFVIGQLF